MVTLCSWDFMRKITSELHFSVKCSPSSTCTSTLMTAGISLPNVHVPQALHFTEDTWWAKYCLLLTMGSSLKGTNLDFIGIMLL